MSSDRFTTGIDVQRMNLKRLSTLDPLSNSRSSQGNSSECGSSIQVSSIGQPASSVGSSSRQTTVKVTSAPAFAKTTSGSSTTAVSLQRRSTRDLIDIFENQTVSNSLLTSPASHPLRRGIVNPRFNAPLPDLPKPTQLKQSFRNLIAVFSKGKKGLNEPTIDTLDRRDSQQHAISNGGISSHSRYSRDMDQNSMTAPSTSKPTLSRMAPSLPPELRSGLLLYYEDSPTNPVWHRCDAFLAPPNLRLSYFAPNGIRSTRCISVTTAIDARSIATTKCATVMPPSLDGNTPYVFEIEFDTENKEIFAASSLVERGRWISSIWDAIISSKYGFSSSHRTPSQSEPQTEQFLHLSRASEEKQENISFSLRPRSSERNSEAGRRPIMPNTSVKCNTGSSSSKRSDSTTTVSSRSPSIRTLGSMSIVHKRLARIDTLQRAGSSINTSAYATPPRTPPPEEQISSRERTGLSKIMTGVIDSPLSGVPDDSPEPSDVETERPPSFISPHTFGQLPQSVEEEFKDADVQYQILNAIPRCLSTERPYDLTKGQGGAIQDSSTNLTITATPLDILSRHLTEVATSLQEIKADRHDQQRAVVMLEKNIRSMHKEMKIAFQQPPLPIPQLDNLSDRMNLLAESLHSSDAEAIRLKLERFEELVQTLADLKKDEDKNNLNNARASNTRLVETRDSAVWDEVKGQLPLILEKIKEIQLQIHTDKSLPNVPTDGGEVSKDLAEETRQKLESIESLITTFKSEWKANMVPAESFDPPPGKSLSVFKPQDSEEPDSLPTGCSCEPQVTEIMRLLAEVQEKPTVTLDQFEDSVRYLQELNTWMEKFALHNEGQGSLLSDIKVAIEELTQQSKENAPAESKALDLPAVDQGDFNSTLEDVRSDLVSRLDDINLQLKQDAVPKDGQDLDTVMELVESNHREQKEILRSIFDDLSSDIKGERIRFVDAMKEATSVNVNTHLEEFKRQLNQEMMVMLQEVGRTARARERKHLEQEIAQIFNQQVVERQKSMGFQPLQPMRPLRAVPQGHHPGVMMHPHMHGSVTPVPIPHPTMPMHPSHMGLGSRPLPTPTPRPQSTIQPQEMEPSQQEELLRRKA